MKRYAKLDRKSLRALQPGQRVQEHGILYERLPDGDGRWTVNIRVDGQRVHRVLGLDSTGCTREHCERFIEQARTDARHERLNLPKGRKTVLRFTEAAERYLERMKQAGGRDLPKKRYRLEKHLVPFFGEAPLDKLAGFDVERFKRARRDAGASAGTVNRELAVLCHMLGRAVEWGWIGARPKIARFTEPPGRVVYLTTEQAARLVDAARASDFPYIWLFVEIGLATGMRRSEILSVRLENVDPARRVIWIPRAKAGAREQPITAHLAGILSRELAEAEPGQVWLFPSKRTRSGHLESIEAAFRQVVSAAGLDPRAVVRHTLRHSAVSHLVQGGVDLPTIQKISGHKTLSQLQRYAHADGQHIQAAMDVLERRISAPAPGPSAGTMTQE